MKKYFIILLTIVVLLPNSIKADGYAVLWKKYEKAQEKDLPRTSLQVLNSIIRKAETEDRYGHLLKAHLLHAQVAAQISPDSLTTEIERLKMQLTKVENKNNVLAAVYQSALGSIYLYNPLIDEQSKQLSEAYFKQSLAYPNLLAQQQTNQYEPLLVAGIDSKIFHHDLLHVLAFQAQAYNLMHQYYQATNNRSATCIAALYQLRKQYQTDVLEVKKSKYIRQLDSLLTVYKDLPETAEVAIERYNCMEKADDITAEQKIQFINYALSQWGTWKRINILRNAKARLTLPTFHISLGKEVILPKKEHKITLLQVCNIKQLNMGVWQLNVKGNTTLDPNDAHDYAKLCSYMVSKTPFYTANKKYLGIPNYQISRDTITLKGLPIGVYLVEFTTDNRAIKPQRALLRVSDVCLLSQPMPQNKMRMVVVSATTGQPLPNAKILINEYVPSKQREEQQIYTCNQQGEVYLQTKGNASYNAFTYTENDKAGVEKQVYSYGYFPEKETSDKLYVELFTDRSIYRPGQMLHASAVAYRLINGKKTSVAANTDLTLTLRDANYKEIGTQKVTTDEYGTAVTNFVLPTNTLTGMFSLRCNKGRNAYTSVSVEEYKRPSFYIEFDSITTPYQQGDTVKLTGHVKSFAGVAIHGAQVKYTITRMPVMWRYALLEDRTHRKTIGIDSLITDNKGNFVIKVPMLMPDKNKQLLQRYSFITQVDVTDRAGETQHAEHTLMLSNKSTFLSCNLAKQICIDSIKPFIFSCVNNMGVTINGDVNYTIDGKPYLVKTNQATLRGLEKLHSGKHQLAAICAQDTLRYTFYTFSLDDKKLAFQTPNFFYVTDTTFPNSGKPIYMLLGSSDKDVYVVYTLIAGNRVIESGTLSLNNQIIKKKWKYQAQYEDGLLLNYAWVKNGECYIHKQILGKPKPDKRLVLTWKTFRNRLTPGQKEEWTLQINTPNGKPAKAQLMAVLFDKTLQNIKKHEWSYNIPYQPAWAATSWNTLSTNQVTLYGDAPFVYLKETPIDFTHFDDVFGAFYNHNKIMLMSSRANSKMQDSKRMKMLTSFAETDAIGAQNEMMPANEPLQQKQVDTMPLNKEQSTTPSMVLPAVRQNFNETAFFYPSLITNDRGEVSLKFTLPESVTTWQLMTLAHDKEMRNANLTDEVVAQKIVMIQPNMPRFIRIGDKLMLSARVMSTATHQEKGIAKIEIIDPTTDKTIFTQQKQYVLQPKATDAVTFCWDTKQVQKAYPHLSLLIVRITAKGKTYSDGEQHYLPILSDKDWVTTTVPFTQQQVGVKTIDVKKLFPGSCNNNLLTIEYTNNPAWLMVQALPYMATTNADDAISLVSAYYANSIGHYLLNQTPQLQSVIKQWKQEKGEETSLTSALEKNKALKNILLNETPWVLNAQQESNQKKMLVRFFDNNTLQYQLTSLLEKLQKLQNTDGSFSWWKGMLGNRYMTVEVASTLVRLNTLIGKLPQTQRIIETSLNYLDKKIAQEVTKLKQKQAKGEKNITPSEFAYNYLYMRALTGKQTTNDVNYLINLLSKKTVDLTIYGKANTAVVLSLYGRKEKAQEYLQSIKEYSVYNEEMGRYFDTPRANYSWCDYRIPTQVAAIEATKLLKPTDSSIEEMQQWLLQSKRTQAWDTPINSVNAIYAFLHAQPQKLTTEATMATIQLDKEQLKLPKPTAGLGYIKVTKMGNNMQTLSINKTSVGTSWGAVYAQFMQKSTEVQTHASGLKVMRTLLHNGKPIQTLKVGDKVTVRIVIEANRDYDFIQLQDKRAACLEPLNQLSGYAWGYYCAPKDEVTNYYFDKLSKGKHIIETEYYINRAGNYQTGICTIQCAYSPEYNGRAAAKTLNIN